MANSLDVNRLEREDKEVYRDVAEAPDGEFHFEMGRPLAERLGYPAEDLDRVPDEAIDSFAGVGYHFDLADLQKGDDVLDLGSGSGMDVFVAALHVGETGSVTRLDMTDEQLEKLLGAGTRSLVSDRRTALQYYRSIDHAVDVFSTYFGQTIRAFETGDSEDQERLRNDLGEAFSCYNRATDGTAIVENQYLQTIATRV